MNIINLIIKKRDGGVLNSDEFHFIIKNYLNDSIKDYQMSSLLMAIFLNGLNDKEISYLTNEMIHFGDIVDLSSLAKPTADKHSTGGVGDKTTLVVIPVLSACGMAVAKMSGRGLGFTGGTIDKIESFPGFNVNLSAKKFLQQVSKNGIALVGQSKTMTLADKKLYALRDVTGTVDSIPLIASSIMSKKIASGSKNIILDVKVGDGAFMKNLQSARQLAKTMVKIGNSFQRKTTVVLSHMEQPLGHAVGNVIEVQEAIKTLEGQGPKDLTELCHFICQKMLLQSKVAKTEKDATYLVKNAIDSKSALGQFKLLVESQEGDFSKLHHDPKYSVDIKSTKNGYLKNLNALSIGKIAMDLGAGRLTKDDQIDLQAGVMCWKKNGDGVKKNEVVLTLYSSKPISQDIINNALKSFFYSQKPIQEKKIIIDYLQ